LTIRGRNTPEHDMKGEERMEEAHTTPALPQELEQLVDPDGIRASVRRLFSNKIEEVLGELLQNSQRATASRVMIETTEDGFVYRDNGHGLLSAQGGYDDPYRAFHTLLQMAASYFQNTTLEAQHPMGLGIHALLA